MLTTGDVVGIPNQWVSSKAELAPRPLFLYIREHKPVQLLMGLMEHARLAAIEEKEQSGEVRFCVAYMTPCLIHYNRGGCENRAGLANRT